MVTHDELSVPPLVGPPGEIRAQARSGGDVPVHTIARVAMTRRRVVELIALLQERLDEHDRLMGDR
jgi:hypothetical protein